MKLYYFKPNNYDYEYFVMAESEEKALDYLLENLSAKSTSGTSDSRHYHDEHLVWAEARKMGKLPRQFAIESYAVGQVIESEIS